MYQNKRRSNNLQKVMQKLEFQFPGCSKIPRAPGTYNYTECVDIHIAKKKLELLDRVPIFDPVLIRFHDPHDYSGNRRYISELMATGYSSVATEIKDLLLEEQFLLENKERFGRSQSFVEDKILFQTLIKGLVASFEAEKAENLYEIVTLRKHLGEKMITLTDFWLARKMFLKCFDFLVYVDDETDKMKAEIWCLISYVCIYFEKSQEIGFDLPTKYLMLAQELSQNKRWFMKKSVMNILIPKSTNIYGLKNEWVKIKSDWIILYELCTILLHILSVKKARFWQEELNSKTCQSQPQENHLRKSKSHNENRSLAYKHVEEELISALAYADEVRQIPAFIATTLRRGLFYEECGDIENAMEDFNALHTLTKNFDDKESLAMTLSHLGYHQIRCKNTPIALDYFVQELEIARDYGFPELLADAMQKLGNVLLQEGHTWEADECYNNAYTIFHDTKVSDTPNDLDEISWAMMGISRGHHLWGRYSALIRTQERRNLRAVNEWKCTRKPMPLVKMPKRLYTPNYRSDFDKQYRSSMEEEEENDNTRRLFEFPSEIRSKKSMWYKTRGYANVFQFINASQKERVPPKFSEYLLDDEDLNDLTKRRTLAAIRKTTEFDRSLKKKREWFNRVSSIFELDPNEAENAKKMLPKHAASWNAFISTKSSNSPTIKQTMENFLDDASKAVNSQEETTVLSELEDASEDSEIKM